VRIGPGTLYGALQRLAEEGWIEERTPARDEAPADERRRYYRLTKDGRKAASVEAARLRDMVDLARARRLLGHA
jgi:DNA-binding PadR family transcriptional regulator